LLTSALFFALAFLFEDLYNIFPETGNHGRDNFPKCFVINTIIPVRHDVPEPGYLLPRDTGITGFEIFRKVLCRLTNDLKVPDYGIFESWGL